MDKKFLNCKNIVLFNFDKFNNYDKLYNILKLIYLFILYTIIIVNFSLKCLKILTTA